MRYNQILTISAFLLLIFFPSMAHADEGCAAAGVTGSGCIMCGSTPCMERLIPEICAGTVNPDYAQWGPLVWLGGSDGCTCYCPYSKVTDYYAKQCAAKSCPASRCSGNYLSSGGSCDTSDGNCKFAADTYCDYGCDEASSSCKQPEAKKECSNACKFGEEQKAYPDCSCKVRECTNKCAGGEEQKAAPDCSCVKNSCDDSCAGGETQRPYPDCSCEEKDLCKDVKCPDICYEPKNDYASINISGECGQYDGKCSYTQKTCTAGCTINGGKASCNEDCDNGADDDGNNLADCDDPACKQSIYCSCKLIGSQPGSIGGKTLKFLVGGYNMPAPGPFYGYLDRDKDVEGDAQAIYQKLSSTAPFSEANIELYATRMPMDMKGPWRGDLLAKCPDVGAGFTIFIDYTTSSTPSSRAYSMNANMYKSTTAKTAFAATTLHEIGHGFAGLWDEYTVAKDFGIFTGTGATMRDFTFADRANCAVSLSEAACNEYFKQFGVGYQCVQGCTAAVWYRPSESSIMMYPDKSGEFNKVSQEIIRRRITSFAKPKPISLPAPAAAYGKPQAAK